MVLLEARALPSFRVVSHVTDIYLSLPHASFKMADSGSKAIRESQLERKQVFNPYDVVNAVSSFVLHTNIDLLPYSIAFTHFWSSRGCFDLFKVELAIPALLKHTDQKKGKQLHLLSDHDTILLILSLKKIPNPDKKPRKM